MAVIRIMADDLTGALDAAAPFALAQGPLPVLWRAERLPAGSFAFDSESRTVRRADWASCLRASAAGAELCFKKVDSLMRDRTATEIIECWQSGLFQSLVIAPAFPAQQRITRHGRHYWRPSARGRWRLLPCDLRQSFARRGLALPVAAGPAELPAAGPVLCDATGDQDLNDLVAAAGQLAKPLLWCGSAGLAHALAGGARPAPPPPLRPPLLVIIGTRHPVTRRQITRLAEQHGPLVVRLPAGSKAAISATLDRLATALAAGRAALVFDLPSQTAAGSAAAAINAVFAALPSAVAQPASLVVTGGSTLMRLMQALGSEALTLAGELEPGIALSTIAGGAWHGSRVVSKSGAFGSSTLLARLLASPAIAQPEIAPP